MTVRSPYGHQVALESPSIRMVQVLTALVLIRAAAGCAEITIDTSGAGLPIVFR